MPSMPGSTRSMLSLGWLWAGSLVVAPLCLSGCGSAARSPSPSPSNATYHWAGKNGDALRTGATTHVAPRDLAGGPAWSYTAPNTTIIRAAPVIDEEGSIYLATVGWYLASGVSIFGTIPMPGWVTKFAPDGRVLWTWEHPSAQLPDIPMLMDGSLYVTSSDAEVIALDMQSGEPRWQSKIGQCSAGDTWAMTASNGVIVSAIWSEDVPDDFLPEQLKEVTPYSLPNCSYNAQLVGLDQSGTVLWRFTPDTLIYNILSAVANDGTTLVFADATGTTYRLDLQTGKLLWKHSTRESGVASLSRGLAAPVPVANFSFSTGGAVMGPNEVIYVTSNANQTIDTEDPLAMGGVGWLSAYGLRHGDLLWRKELALPANNGAAVGKLGKQGSGPLAVVVVIGNNPGLPPQRPADPPLRSRVVAFDATTGDQLWEYALEWAFAACAGDTLDPPHVCLPDDASNPAIDGDGTVYFGFMDGRLYAINDLNNDSSISDDEVSYYDGGNAYQGSPAIAPGMLVATPCNAMHVFKRDEPHGQASSNIVL